MIDDYRELLNEIRSRVQEIGFELTEDREFIAIFKNNNGWKIIFEGERYVRPAFDLSIVSASENKQEYSISILMQLFQKSAAQIPSLSNQLKFLFDYYDSLFIEPQTYKEQYEKLNAVDYDNPFLKE